MRCASALLALCLGGSACSRPSSAPHADARKLEVADASLASTAAQRAPAQPTRRPARRAEVRALQGSARRATEPLTGLATLSAEDELTLERGAIVTLALDDHVELRLFGPLRARLMPEGEPALLLREGALSVDCAPRAARSTESAFWLATPDARIDVFESARLVVDARTGRATEFALVSGSARLWTRGDAGELALAGEVRCIGEVARAGERELARAEKALMSGAGCKPRRAAADLGALLGELERKRERERELVSSHRALLDDADAAAARREELAELARSQLLTRERARALRSSVEAELVDPDAAQRALLARARELAPYRF